MKVKYSHVLMFLGILVAFVPILSVDYLLDQYVRHKEKAALQDRVNDIGTEINRNVADVVGALRGVIADSPSFCTPTFADHAQRAIENNLLLKQILVSNIDDVQYCDAYGRRVDFSPLSGALPVPGRTETITIAQFAKLDMPAIKVTQTLGAMRRVSGFAPLLGETEETLSSVLQTSSVLRISLTSGLPILEIGDTTNVNRVFSSDTYLMAQSYAGELPIKIEYALPFAAARANYAQLDVVFSIIACLTSICVLLLALAYARKSRAPTFDLERAIGRNEIKPYYQPVINLRTGALVGCEVLCRWEKPNGDVIPPGVFIDHAEASGLAVPMTLSLMQQVRQDLGDLCRIMPRLKISINLFEGHFRDAGIVGDVQAIFGNSSINYNQLVFEITERRPLANSAAVNNVISCLHSLGARLAMDDAGTGHSNLAYIATLGVDVIKIDRIFVEMIKPGTVHVPVLDGLIAMAKDLNCEIVAEGVETEEQAIYLRTHGVVQAQGYIFAPALKVGAFKELAMALHRVSAEADTDMLASAEGRNAVSAA